MSECYSLYILNSNTSSYLSGSGANITYAIPAWSSIIPEELRSSLFQVKISISMAVGNVATDSYNFTIGLQSLLCSNLIAERGCYVITNFNQGQFVTSYANTNQTTDLISSYPTQQFLNIQVQKFSSLTTVGITNYMIIISFFPIKNNPILYKMSECYQLVINSANSANSTNRTGSSTASYSYFVNNWSSIIPEKYKNNNFIVRFSFSSGIATVTQDSYAIQINELNFLATDCSGSRANLYIITQPTFKSTTAQTLATSTQDTPDIMCSYPNNNQITVNLYSFSTMTAFASALSNY